MSIECTHHGVKFLFEQCHTFSVPKFQRGYAWDEDAIRDFIEDLSRCLKSREGGEIKNHFFGGVVTVKNPITNSSRSNYEVIDGQQRLASFVMLITAVVSGIRGVVDDLSKKGNLADDEAQAKTFLEETIKSLREKYLIYRDEISLNYCEVPKLTLSDADDEFFRNIDQEDKASANRASHKRIQEAWNRLVKFVDDNLLKEGSALEKANRLKILMNSVLANDCTVIFMCTETRTEAYQIFQVLNDRGVHLTDGDLLRASTLELLDSNKLMKIQDKLSKHWDRILAYEPIKIDKYLRWYYSSYEGKRPKRASLADQFIEFRFGCKDKTSATTDEAQDILKQVKTIDEEFKKLQMLGDGEWPYEDHNKVARWDRERLRMLVSHLDHKNAMPLLLSLLSLEKLKPEKFAEVVATLERFFFRFKTIGKAHEGSMTGVYLRHAKEIRDGSSFEIKGLRSDLQGLITKKVPDGIFEANLSELRYSPSRGNGYIRYLVITLEDYAKWYEDGANGVPRCHDKNRVFDFSNTTLEHIYPRSAKDSDKNKDLEKVKDALGNLTVFGPNDNNAAANKSFAEKRQILKGSNLKLNREISAYNLWTADQVKQRADGLIAMALKVFVP